MNRARLAAHAVLRIMRAFLWTISFFGRKQRTDKRSFRLHRTIQQSSAGRFRIDSVQTRIVQKRLGDGTGATVRHPKRVKRTYLDPGRTPFGLGTPRVAVGACAAAVRGLGELCTTVSAYGLRGVYTTTGRRIARRSCKRQSARGRLISALGRLHRLENGTANGRGRHAGRTLYGFKSVAFGDSKLTCVARYRVFDARTGSPNL